MKITEIEAMVVQKPAIDTTAADAMQDAFIVCVKTDEGSRASARATTRPTR
jgi:hypothetical protein